MKPEVEATKSNCLSAFSIIEFYSGVRMGFYVQVVSKNWLGIMSAYSTLKRSPQGLVMNCRRYTIYIDNVNTAKPPVQVEDERKII